MIKRLDSGTEGGSFINMRLVLTIPFFVFVGIIFLFLNSTVVIGETLTVDDDGSSDYPSIRYALENASKGDTIRVYDGFYQEQFILGKQISLVGNGSGSCTISGDGQSYVVRISADGVNVSGFRIQNGDDGIRVEADNSRISDIQGFDNDDGIEIFQGNFNLISNSTFQSNEIGIHLSKAQHTTIQNTTCSDNEFYGIYSFDSKYGEISDNLYTRNMIGMFFLESESINVIGSDCDLNDKGGLRLKDSNGFTVSHNDFTFNENYGIKLQGTSDTLLENNRVSFNSIGIIAEDYSGTNTAYKNDIFGNLQYGIDLSGNQGNEIDAFMNWWGDLTGPHHPNDNPAGKGDNVTDLVLFSPWTDDEGMDFLHNLSIAPPDTPNFVDPGGFVGNLINITNYASRAFDLGLWFDEDNDDLQNLTILFPAGDEIGVLNPQDTTIVDVIVLIDSDASPGYRTFEITVGYANDSRMAKTFTLHIYINQSHGLSTILATSPPDNAVVPQEISSFIWKITNTGTGTDTVTIRIPEEVGSNPNIPSGWSIDPIPSTLQIASGESKESELQIYVPQFAEPISHDIQVWFNFHNNTEKRIEIINVSVNVIYRARFDVHEGTYTVAPDHENPGIYNASITVKNEGNVRDTLNFEFELDSPTNRFKKWITLPEEIILDSGESKSLDFEIKVMPYNLDPDAIADGQLKDISIRIYSMDARSHNMEEIGNTTDSYLCHVFITEYRYATIVSVVPWAVTTDIGVPKSVNVTILNQGNGFEEYFLVKDGEDGTGQNVDWYEFNITSAMMAPMDLLRVTLIVDPPIFAPSGNHDLHFHAQSESTFKTEEDFVRVDINEYFGGVFVGGDEKTSPPGETVSMKISVRNTGNEDHYFKLNDPFIPEGWIIRWSGGNQKQINRDTTDSFNLQIDIPYYYPKARAGLYEFKIIGFYEDKGGGWSYMPGFALLNLTVEERFGVAVDTDDWSDEAKPGETVTYKVEIKNTGNVNDTFLLSILRSSHVSNNAKDWASFQGLEPGNKMIIEFGKTRVIDVVVQVPGFTPDNDDAIVGLYGLKIKAKSMSDSSEFDEVVFELDVEPTYDLDIWVDYPGKNETLRINEDLVLYYTITARNLGNIMDDLVFSVSNDEFSDGKKNWKTRFGTMDTRILTLEPLEQDAVIMTLTIHRLTPEGSYTLRVRAHSDEDTSKIKYTTIYINLSHGRYDLYLESIGGSISRINPADKEEVEFKFSLINTGDQEDSYIVKVETPLTKGTYKGWTMEFETKDEERVDEIELPGDLPYSEENFLEKGSIVDLTLYVTVAIWESEGFYDDITISATSKSDLSKVAHLNFNVSVILPNIRLSDDPSDFHIDPEDNIEEGDSLDIFLRIFNQGSAETDDFYVFFYNGKGRSTKESAGNYIAFERVGNILASSYADILVTWENIEGGDNDIYAVADKPIRSGTWATKDINGNFLEDGLVMESSENDNTALIDHKYEEAIDLRPDLTIIGVEFDGFEEGKTTTVTVTVANIGSAKAEKGSGAVWLKIGGVFLKDKETNRGNPTLPYDIEIGDDIDIEFKWPIDYVINYTVKASVDHPDDSYSANDRMITWVVTVEGDDDNNPWDYGTLWVLIGIILLIACIATVSFIYTLPTEKLISGKSQRKLNPGKYRPIGISSMKTTSKIAAGSGPPDDTVPFGRLSNVPQVVIEFPVIDLCLGCGAKLRVYKPGPIQCPFCRTIAQVDSKGRFLQPDEREYPGMESKDMEMESGKFEGAGGIVLVPGGTSGDEGSPGKGVSPDASQETEQLKAVEENGLPMGQGLVSIISVPGDLADDDAMKVEEGRSKEGAMRTEERWREEEALRTEEEWRREGARRTEERWREEEALRTEEEWRREGAMEVEREWGKEGASFEESSWGEEDEDADETSMSIQKPHWNDNELVRKRKILADYMEYRDDPEVAHYIRTLKKQIRTMESYGRRNTAGFPNTSFIASKKDELVGVLGKPSQWLTREEKHILKSYPPKIRAFEDIIGMSVGELMVELAEEELREGEQREVTVDNDSFRPYNVRIAEDDEVYDAEDRSLDENNVIGESLDEAKGGRESEDRTFVDFSAKPDALNQVGPIQDQVIDGAATETHSENDSNESGNSANSPPLSIAEEGRVTKESNGFKESNESNGDQYPKD